MIYFVRFSCHNPKISAAAIVKFLKTNWQQARTLPLATLVYVANCIKRGEGWEPDLLDLNLGLRTELINGTFVSDILLADVTKEEEDHDRFIEHCKLVQDLLGRGANGDAEAAIEYCRMEKQGLISHAPFA